ncbi:MAG: hypothetical protein O7G83_10855 [Proteobacteria bacterium]|nr:hypothetical protein [Pseudomonadota bacterium]
MRLLTQLLGDGLQRVGVGLEGCTHLHTVAQGVSLTVTRCYDVPVSNAGDSRVE